MPVEIRELVIKTTIAVNERTHPEGLKEKNLHALKSQLLEECRRIIAEKIKRSNNKR